MARGALKDMPEPEDEDPNDTDGEPPKDDEEPKSPGEEAAEDFSAAISGGDPKEIWESFQHMLREAKMSGDDGEGPMGGSPKTGLLAILGKKKA